MGAFLAGCASLPPVKAIKSPADIAGKWKGTLLLYSGREIPATLHIDANLNYFFKGPKYSKTNTFIIEGGKVIMGRNRDGTMTLHAGEGNRILATQNEWAIGNLRWRNKALIPI